MRITLTYLLSFLPLAVFAGQNSNLNVKIGGSVDVKYGIVNQQKDFGQDLKSKQKYNKGNLANSGSVKFNIDSKNDDGLKYGAFLKLGADIEGDKELKGTAKEAKIYLEGAYGKVELGSTAPVGKSMGVNSYSLARATGGLDGDWKDWLQNGGVITGGKGTNDGFLTSPQLPIGFDDGNKANKVNYFSPKFNGFSFGISYTPDSKAKGTNDQVKGLTKNSGPGYRNVLQPTVRYEKSFDGGVKFTTAVLGEFGSARDYPYWEKEEDEKKKGPVVNHIKRKDLRAWQVGASVEYNGIAFAGSYGDFGKSGTAKDDNYVTKDNKYGAKYWSLGSAYSTEKYGISINYMQSKRAGFIFGKDKETVKASASAKSSKDWNKFEAISIGADYQVMPGFMPYIEATRFKFKENKTKTFNGKNAKFNKGTVFLAGTKISF